MTFDPEQEREFVRLVVRMGQPAAERLIDDAPELAEAPVVAALRGDSCRLQAGLEADPGGATRPVFPDCPPLWLLAHARAPGDELGCARLLLAHGAELGAGPPDDELPGGVSTPLAMAVKKRGRLGLARWLLEEGAPVNDGAALFVACAAGGADAVQLLLDAGAELDRPSPDGSHTPLTWMLDLRYGRAEVEALLERGADPNVAVGTLGETALFVATRRRRAEILPALVRAGAQLDARTRGGMSAYRHAVRRGFLEVADALLQLGADAELAHGDRLARALMAEELDAARELLAEKPGEVHGWGPEETRLLADLTGYCKLGAMQLLLDAGCPLDARGLDGGTALHQAAWFGQPRAVRWLIERGAQLDPRGDLHDSTPLGWATHGSRFSGGAAEREAHYVEIVEQLLAAGAPLPGPDERHDWSQLGQAVPAVREVLERHGYAPPRPPA